MAHMLIVTAVVVLVYGLAAAAVLAVYRAADDAAGTRATLAVRRMTQRRAEQPRRSADEQLALAEAAVSRRVVAGRLDPAAYQRTMAAIAAQDAATHPLTTPEPPQDPP